MTQKVQAGEDRERNECSQQRALEHFSIGQDLVPREMIAACATLKKAAANANHAGGRLDDERHRLIVQNLFASPQVERKQLTGCLGYAALYRARRCTAWDFT
jgi:fumarate hydratase class II